MFGVTIGNFDGVHLGHRALLDRARAGEAVERVAAVTFEPAPAVVLGRSACPRVLAPKERRRRLLEAGADDVLELRTDRDLLDMPPDDFLQRLADDVETRLGGSMVRVVEGPDFRFGHRRAGDVARLAAVGEDRGFEVEVVPEVRIRLQDGLEVPARSSTIRRLLELGRVEDAARLLGRPHTLVGTVVSGDQRGRTLGIPTANLNLDGAMLPADGVYAGIAVLPDGERRPAAISVGTKPTFEETPPVAEVHVMDWDGRLDDYGWRLEATLHRRLRGQERYDGLDPFLAQLERDLANVRSLIAPLIEPNLGGPR